MSTSSTPGPNSLAVFEEYKQAINKSLAAYLEELPSKLQADTLPAVARQALDLICEFTLRPGKRVRGALAALAYDKSAEKHLSTAGLMLAVTMELLQSYILIMDDVTDKSDLRRGEPTVHRLYEQQSNGLVGEREAEQLAFYTGMIGGHIASLALLETGEKPENIARAMRYVHQNVITTGFGQLDDIMQEISREASADDIIRKYALKTSYYTFINPLHAGMALAGVTDEAAYQAVAAFGVAAGVAFQTHDDYLGIFGGEETGKPNLDDISEGKLTILMQYALQHASPEDAQMLRGYLGNHRIGAAELVATRRILNASGATMEARRTAKHYADEAVRQLSAIKIWNDNFKSLLAELVTYSISRKS